MTFREIIAGYEKELTKLKKENAELKKKLGEKPRVIEKIVEVPVEKIIEKIVEVPIEVEKPKRTRKKKEEPLVEE